MRIFTYIVARDFGFAPNPFHGACTLATCKPEIRRLAGAGDIVLGKASTAGEKNPVGHVVYAMRVNETLTFDEYWHDPRFARKRPKLNGSRKQRYGDNIYRRAADGSFIQADSHHSWQDGVVNQLHLDNDTSVDRVLIGDEFVYWGGDPEPLPDDLVETVGGKYVRQKWRFTRDERKCVLEWISPLLGLGFTGRPGNWD